MSKLAIFVANEKGGVGKSTWSRGWIDIARSREKKVAGFDADGAVGELLEHYGVREGTRLVRDQDPLKGIGYFNIMSENEQEILLNALDAGGDAILIDTPAGALDAFEKPLGSSGNLFREYREAGYDPIMVLVVDDKGPSARSVVKALRRFGDAVKYVIVQNQYSAGLDGFREFDEIAGEAVKKAGGTIISMPRLRAQTFKRVAEEKLSFAGATQKLARMDRSAVRYWLADFADQIKDSPVDVELIK